MDNNNIIINCVVSPASDDWGSRSCRYRKTFLVELSDGTFDEIGRWFGDERWPNIETSDLVGKTIEEAHDMYHNDDVAYIKSWV